MENNDSVLSIIELMHYFDINIRIFQLQNSDIDQGEAEMNITLEGWLILKLPGKECTNCFVIWYCFSFPNFLSYPFINSSKMFRMHWKQDYSQQLLFKFFEYAYEIWKRIAFFKLLFS